MDRGPQGGGEDNKTTTPRTATEDSLVDRELIGSPENRAFSRFRHCSRRRMSAIFFGIRSGLNGRRPKTAFWEAGLSAMAGLGGDELLSTSDVARLLGFAADYVRRLARTGQIPTVGETGAGYKLFKRSDVVEFARNHTQTQPRQGRRRRELNVNPEERPKK